MGDIIIAPFSNGDIRDWPADHYARLIQLLDERHDDGVIRVVGSRTQMSRASEIVRASPADRVVNACGRLSWSEVQSQLSLAACVIGNNSGIAHLAAHLGVPTVCVFGGAHQRTEWRPVGFNVALVSRAIGCAPCMLHRAADCSYGLACLGLITPEAVCEAAMAVMARVGRSVSSGAWRVASERGMTEQATKGLGVA